MDVYYYFTDCTKGNSTGIIGNKHVRNLQDSIKKKKRKKKFLSSTYINAVLILFYQYP